MALLKHSLLVTYGQKESDIIKEIKNDSSHDSSPVNMNEIFRRGLHCYNALAKVDEERLIRDLGDLFSEFLTIEEKQYLTVIQGSIERGKNLSLITYSILLAKKGMAYADLFMPILTGISSIEQAMNEYVQQKKLKDPMEETVIPPSIREQAKDLGSAVKTIFRRHDRQS